MTVEALDVENQVICTWFERTKKKQDRFAIAVLEPAKKAVGGGAIGFFLELRNRPPRHISREIVLTLTP